MADPLQAAPRGAGRPCGLARRRGNPRSGARARRRSTWTSSSTAIPRGRARDRARGGRAACFALSEEFGAWRVLARDSSWQVDVEPLRGGSLDADLALRDFTVNAIAEPIAGGEPIDPLGGLADLAAGRLRMAGAGAFADDPLRVLRLVRVAVELGLEPEPETLRAARERAEELVRCSPERVFVELRRIIAAREALHGLELMSELRRDGGRASRARGAARRRAEPLSSRRRARPHAGGARRTIELTEFAAGRAESRPAGSTARPVRSRRGRLSGRARHRARRAPHGCRAAAGGAARGRPHARRGAALGRAAARRRQAADAGGPPGRRTRDVHRPRRARRGARPRGARQAAQRASGCARTWRRWRAITCGSASSCTSRSRCRGGRCSRTCARPIRSRST